MVTSPVTAHCSPTLMSYPYVSSAIKVSRAERYRFGAPPVRQSTRHHLNYVAFSPTHPLTAVSSHISSRRLPISYLNPFPP